MVRIDGALLALEGFDVLTPVDGAGPDLRDPVAEAPGTLRDQPGAGHLPRRARASGGSGSTCSSSATRSAPCSGPSPSRSCPSSSSACPGTVRQFADLPRGLVLVTGPDGFGQVDDAGCADRHHQRHQAAAHHVGRGPDRVPAPPQDGGRQPARGGRGHQGFRERP